MNAIVREPAVAGMFYPGRAADVKRQLDRLIRVEEDRHGLLICVAPHAGYVYSGGVAGRVYGHLDIPARVVILGPNHTGLGERVAIASHDRWQTPTGAVPVDHTLGESLIGAYSKATLDAQAHSREHSIEVQLPFLMARRADVTVLPICLKHLSLAECTALGEALAEVIAAADEPVGIVVSSDMSHYEPEEQARTLDRAAIDATLTLNPAELFHTVHEQRISMCGVIPATVALAAADKLGAGHAHLVDYATSGDTSGDRSAEVGYAGICIHH